MGAAVDHNEVFLYGTYFPILRPVTPRLVAPWGSRIVIGDPSRSDQQVVSEWIMSDWRGGLGVTEMDERTQPDRFRHSTCLTLYKRQLTQPFRAVDTGNGSMSGSPVVYGLLELSDELYAAFNTSVKKFNNSTAAWGTALATLSANPTDSIVFDGKMFWLTSGNYTYSADGSTFTTVGETARYACIYDGKLVVIDNTGQLKSSVDGLTWINNAKLPLPAGYYTDLKVFWNAAGEPAIHVGTREGVWVVDFWNQQAYPTAVQFAASDWGGRCLGWKDGNLYVADDLAVHRFSGGGISSVGLDRDDGLPRDLRGSIVGFSRSPNWLIALLDASVLSISSPTTWPYTAAPVGADVVNRSTGYAAILAWTGVGWHILHQSSILNSGSRAVFFSTVHSENRLWFGADGSAKYMVVPEGLYNPLEDSNIGWGLSSEHTTPWFDAGFSESLKIGISLRLRGRFLSGSDYIQVYYATDDDESWSLLTTMTANQPADVIFRGGPGIEFYKIRFRYVFTSTTATSTPVLSFASLRFRKVPKTVWGWGFQVNCTRDHRNVSAAELMRRIEQAAENKTPNGTTVQMGEFSFRDGKDANQTYWVNVSGLAARQWTGAEDDAIYDVTVLAP